MSRVGSSAALFFILSLAARARDAPPNAEVMGEDGKARPGRVAWDGSRGLRFEAAGAELPFGRVVAVRFTPIDPPPLLRPVLHRVALHGRQSIVGELLGFEGETLLLRTAWAEKLPVPRAAVEAVTHLPGFRPVALEDFDAGPGRWSLSGGAAVLEGEATSGKHALVLDRDGQTARFRLAKPVQDGTAAVHFLAPTGTPAAEVAVELAFAGDKEPRTVSVKLAGRGERYAVSVPAKSSYEGAAPRKTGWHRFRAEYSADRLLLLVDEYVLWSGARKEIAGPLRECRFTCTATGGEVRLDDFAVTRAVPESEPDRSDDPSQDTVVDVNGDETFGRIVRLDPLRVTQQARARPRPLDWRDVRSVLLRREALALRPTSGDHVRLRLRADDGQREELEGAVLGLDGERLTLLHPALGELRIPVARLAELRPVFRGRRIPIESRPRHLGHALKAGFAVPRGEGDSARWSIRLESAPTQAVLFVEAAHLTGPGDGPAAAAALRRGGLVTEARVNGKSVGNLNQRVDRASDESTWVRIPLPEGLLTAGANAIELRQLPDSETGRAADCEVRGLRLDLPAP